MRQTCRRHHAPLDGQLKDYGVRDCDIDRDERQFLPLSEGTQSVVATLITMLRTVVVAMALICTNPVHRVRKLANWTRDSGRERD